MQLKRWHFILISALSLFFFTLSTIYVFYLHQPMERRLEYAERRLSSVDASSSSSKETGRLAPATPDAHGDSTSAAAVAHAVAAVAAAASDADEEMRRRYDDYVPREKRRSVQSEQRRAALMAAMRHVWSAYEAAGLGADEVEPVTGRAKKNAWGGMGATLVDALDTLMLMNMTGEFERARAWLAAHFSADVDWNGSIFEVTIRYIGGFLAAFDRTGDRAFVRYAQQVAERLKPAFRTQSGLAYTTVNLHTGQCSNPSWNGRHAVLSEFASLAPEWRLLTHVTGDASYAKLVDHIGDLLAQEVERSGAALLPTYWSERTGRPTNAHVTFGARGDSYVEYLLKQYLESRGADRRAKAHYDAAINETMRRLVRVSDGAQRLTWLAEADGANLIEKMDELACFVPGMLTLDGDDSHLELAERLATTCFHLTADTATGIAPEIAGFHSNGKGDGKRDFTCQAPHNLLRPETVESMFYLWRRTHRQLYRDRAWQLWSAWEKHARTGYGYSGIRNVDTLPVVHDNRMESYFVAETLKYVYLIFSPDELVNLDTHFFNTEGQ